MPPTETRMLDWDTIDREWELIRAERLTCASGTVFVRLLQHRQDARWMGIYTCREIPSASVFLVERARRAEVEGLFACPAALIAACWRDYRTRQENPGT
jgi:hypothetical protein